MLRLHFADQEAQVKPRNKLNNKKRGKLTPRPILVCCLLFAFYSYLFISTLLLLSCFVFSSTHLHPHFYFEFGLSCFNPLVHIHILYIFFSWFLFHPLLHIHISKLICFVSIHSFISTFFFLSWIVSFIHISTRFHSPPILSLQYFLLDPRVIPLPTFLLSLIFPLSAAPHLTPLLLFLPLLLLIIFRLFFFL